VLISDEALRASATLTDRYVTDRMRPDKAIDALDEACAHLQAVVTYTPRTEQLIQQRLMLLKQGAKADQDEKRREGKQPEQEAFGPLERFGAEIEAFFVGTPAPVGGEATKPPVQPQAEMQRGVTLAPLEAELGRALMEEGVVIRGHDVARVVGLMAGLKLDWEAEAIR
jgi:ATP-dependent Clp protease ATP-binding subunit ClpA